MHVVRRSDGELNVWLGEAKLYIDMRGAIREAVASLREHVDNEFLRREFVAVTNKLDNNWPHVEQLKELLDKNTSLDAIIDRIVMPVLIAYESPTVAAHVKVDDAYIADLITEAKEAWHYFGDTIGFDFPVTVQIIILPLAKTSEVRDMADARLRAYQGL